MAWKKRGLSTSSHIWTQRRLNLCCVQVTGLLLKYQERFQIAPIFSEAEVRHYFLPVPDVIDTYVVEGSSKLLQAQLSLSCNP